MSNSGYEFERETGDSLRAIEGTYVHKLVDTHAFQYCPMCEARLNIILPKQPSDYLVVYRGHPIFIECKSSRNPISYNIKYIAVHQLEDAFAVEKSGAIYYFVISMRKPRNMEAYVLRPQQLAQVIANMTTKAAVRWSEIAAHGLSLDRDMHNQIWMGWEAILNEKTDHAL